MSRFLKLTYCSKSKPIGMTSSVILVIAFTLKAVLLGASLSLPAYGQTPCYQFSDLYVCAQHLYGDIYMMRISDGVDFVNLRLNCSTRQYRWEGFAGASRAKVNAVINNFCTIRGY